MVEEGRGRARLQDQLYLLLYFLFVQFNAGLPGLAATSDIAKVVLGIGGIAKVVQAELSLVARICGLEIYE